MGRADQHPFLFDLVQPAQQELPEPACLLDLPKHRLDRLLAQPIREPWPAIFWAMAASRLPSLAFPAAGAAVPCFCRPAATNPSISRSSRPFRLASEA